jgi:hypothetical protein
MILTPSGIRKISELCVGDSVYNENGKEIKVIGINYSGRKEVYDLCNHGRVLETCTLDHRWLAGYTGKKKSVIKSTEEIRNNSGYKISRVFVKAPMGCIDEPHAYVIGVLAGNGCCRQGRKHIHVSSNNESVIKRCADILRCEYKKQHITNYTWVLKTTSCNYFIEWLKNKYSYEKTLDIEVIRKWNRSSQLALLAGLVDTDGSVGVSTNILNIQFSSTSIHLMELFVFLIYNLFQLKLSIYTDKRTKYKSGHCYSVGTRNNMFSKIILKELDDYLHDPIKKWRDAYAFLNERNSCRDYVGIYLDNKRMEDCYDIEVDSPTHLYLTANGLITHNSYLLCLMADEYCRRHDYCIVKYAAPTQKQVRDIIKPLFNKIWRDCPAMLVPRYVAMDSCFIYPNGSKLSMAGCDLGKIDRLRGDSCWLALIDEAGMIEEDLHYIIKDILMPQSLTIQKNDNIDGKVIIASTPPKTPSHPFVSYIAEAECSGKNNYIKKTIYDNTMLSKETILDYAVEAGCTVEGEKITKYSTTFRREYLAEVITDESLAICPEFNDATEKDLVMEHKRPEYFDAYISMDPGLIDLTAIIFGYWDFVEGLLIIEDEVAINYKDGLNTEMIANAIKDKELGLWGKRRPYLRVMDTNSILCQDLSDLHGLQFFHTEKDDKEAAVNGVRLLVHNKKMRIHPRCKTLRAHLKYGVWNKSKTKFDKSGEFGHFDMVDALIYLVRNLDRNKNPFPQDYNIPTHANHYVSPNLLNKKTEQEKVYTDLFIRDKNEIVPYEDVFSNWFTRKIKGR